MYTLYVVTDAGLSNGLSHSEICELACRGGADVIQLRDKEMDDSMFSRYAREMKRICDKYGALFIDMNLSKLQQIVKVREAP